MEVPKSFKPKNVSKEGIKKLLGRKAGKNHSDKAFFHDLSFKQLENLVELKDKVDYLKVDFEYNSLAYQLVYTPDVNADGYVLLQLLQKQPASSIKKSLWKLKVLYLSTKVKDNFFTYHTSAPFLSGIEANLTIEFLLKKNHFFMKKLEELFTPKYSKFKNIQIYVEYRDLTKDDMEYVDLIPKKHRLEKSLA